MSRKLYVLGFTLMLVLGLFLYGCSSQPGASSGNGNNPFTSANTNENSSVTSYPVPAADLPKPDLSYPVPGANSPEPGMNYPAPNAGNPGNPPEGEAALPLSMQLALGTLKLEGTDNAVTPEQADNLLLLWKVAYNLSTSQDVKAETLEAAFEQIEDAMTAEQLEAIQSMEITSEDMISLAEELGIDLPSNPFPTLSAEQQATMQASGQSGMPPAGATPGAGGIPGGMGTPPPPGGAQNPPGGGNPPVHPGGPGGFEVVFYQAVIDLLETKIQ